MKIPLLILAYNRPDKLENLLERIKDLELDALRISVDGFKKNSLRDRNLVQEVYNVIQQIDWISDLKINKISENLGLRYAIPNAVSWVLSEFDSAIILEDDVLPGPDFLSVMSDLLIQFKDNHSIGHISGHNIVPRKILDPRFAVRLSHFPKSYAWGTWSRAWKFYSDDLSTSTKLSNLIQKTPKSIGLIGKLAWRREFINTKKQYLNSWAYRWTWSIWSNEMYAISPSVNLITYTGHDEGTNVRSRSRWKELPIERFNIESFKNVKLNLQADAEKWESHNVYRGKLWQLVKLYLISVVLFARKVFLK